MTDSALLGVDGATAELLDHRQVVSDRPPLGDAAVLQAVGESCLAPKGAGGEIVAAERAARPLLFAHAELHHVVTRGNDMRLDPTSRMLVALGFSKEVAG